MGQHKFNQRIANELRRHKEKGGTDKAFGEKHGVSTATVCLWRKKAKIGRLFGGGDSSQFSYDTEESKKAREKKALKMYHEGHNIEAIAQEIGKCYKTVYRLINSATLTGGLTGEEICQLVKIFEENPDRTNTEIAKAFGTHYRVITLLKTKYNKGVI